MPHAIKHWPVTSSGCGWGVCECGATIRIENGQPVGKWHVCALCVVESCEDSSKESP